MTCWGKKGAVEQSLCYSSLLFSPHPLCLRSPLPPLLCLLLCKGKVCACVHTCVCVCVCTHTHRHLHVVHEVLERYTPDFQQ